MSAIVVTLIVLLCLATTNIVVNTIYKKYKGGAMKKLLMYFSEEGIRNDLSFSSQLILKDCIIGLDGINRKFLIAKQEDGALSSFLIDLNDIKTCTVKKEYGFIKGGDLRNKTLDQYLDKIVLHFEFKNGKADAEIPFYRPFDNEIFEMPELEQKARRWETIISKMQKPIRNIA